MRVLVLLLSSTIICMNLFGQTSFDKKFSSQYGLKNGWQPAIDADNNYFVPFSVVNYEGDLESWAGIMKLDQDGSVVDSINFQSLFGFNSYSGTSEIYILADTLYGFYQLSEIINGPSKYFAVKLDIDLNIVDSLTISFNEEVDVHGPLNVEYYNDKFVMLANYDDFDPDTPSIFANGVFMMEISADFTDIHYELSNDEDHISHVFDFIQLSNGEFVVGAFGAWQYNYVDIDGINSASLGVFNTDLTPEITFEINTSNFWNNIGLESYQDSLLLISGQKSLLLSTNPIFVGQDLAVYKMNSDFTIIDSIEIITEPIIDTVDYTAPQSLSHYFDDQIYFGSTRDVTVPFSNMDHPNHIRLVKLDDNLDVIWEKFYGGDKANFVRGIKATPDGGCIMLCDSYDYDAYPDDFKTDLRIIKVDGDGLVTGIPESSSLEIKSLLVYPNPSNGVFRTETSLREYRMIFFDKSGRIVHESLELSGVQELNLDHLSNGAYPYVVIDKAGLKIDDGKIVLMK